MTCWRLPRPPQFVSLTSSKDVVADEDTDICWLTFKSSVPRMLMAEETWRTMLCVKVTFLDCGPWSTAALITHCEQNRVTVLRGGPVMLENVPVDEHALRVLQFENIFDLP